MHLFEFNDHPCTPACLRTTLFEIMEVCNTRFRAYHEWVCREIVEETRRHGLRRVVELGAGRAPLVSRLAGLAEAANLHLIVCDLAPPVGLYQKLEARYPGRVTGMMTPLDYAERREWGPRTLLVLSATFHHVPPGARLDVLAALSASAERVLVFEPLQRTALSLFLALTSLGAALLLPFFGIGRPGWVRQALWCWLIPLAPLLFLWDATVSCWRLWSGASWQKALARVTRPPRTPASVRMGVHSQAVCW